MRRSDREISNKNEILEVMEKCDVMTRKAAILTYYR